MALPTCQCVANLPPWKQLAPIIAATREWAGLPVEDRCYEGLPISQQLEQWYCALYEIAQNGPNPPAERTLEMDAVFASTEADGVEVTAALFEAAWNGENPAASTVETGNGDPANPVVFEDYGAQFYYTLTAGGQSFNGLNRTGLRFNFLNPAPADPDTNWRGFQTNFSPSFQSASKLLLVAMVHYGDLSDPDAVTNVNTDLFNLSSAAGYTVPQSIYGSGGYRIMHGHSDGELGNSGPIDITKDYALVMLHDQDALRGYYHWVDNETGIVAWASETVLGGPQGNFAYLLAQSYLQNIRGSISVPVFGLNRTNPVYPPPYTIIPAPNNIGVSQNVVDVLALEWDSPLTRFKITRYESTDGFSTPTVIESNIYLETAYEATGFAKAYDDTTVVDGVTYRYVIQANLGAESSVEPAYVEYTVDNGSVAAAGWFFPGGLMEAAFSNTGVTLSDSSNIRTVAITIPFNAVIKRLGVKIVDNGGSSGNPFRMQASDAARNLLVNGAGTIANGLCEIMVADTPVGIGDTVYVTYAMLAGGADVNFYTLPASSGTDVFSGSYFNVPYDPLPATVDFTEETGCAGLYLQPV